MIAEEDPDYEIVDRSHNSVKYFLAQLKQPGIDKDQAIYVSHADMEFKFSPQILPKIYDMEKQPHYGYNVTGESTWYAVRQWALQRYASENVTINRATSMAWHNMLAVINCTVQSLTQPGDYVLIPCPNYYRFIVNVQNFNRVPLQTKLIMKDNKFYFDFEDIERSIVEKNVKLMILSNPANPGGRIWTKEELTQLKDLLLKYKVYLLSDQILSDLIQPNEEQKEKGVTVKDIFTSMLHFEDFKDFLIYGSSFTKAFNCTTIGMAYTICQNPEIKKKIDTMRDKFGVWASAFGRQCLEACYTTEEAQKWRIKTIRYIYLNFTKLQKFAAQHMPKLHVFDMDTPYLCVLDFREYNLFGKDLENAFTKVNVCPTFLQPAYVEPEPHCSIVRLNLALNHHHMDELLDRLKLLVSEL